MRLVAKLAAVTCFGLASFVSQPADAGKNAEAQTNETGILIHANQFNDQVIKGTDAEQVEQGASTAQEGTWVLQDACETVAQSGCIQQYLSLIHI